MSSAAFSIELCPSNTLRAVLACGGVLAALTGVILIAGLPLHLSWRLPLALLWLWSSGRELGAQYRAARQVRSIRLDAAGEICAVAQDGNRHALALQSGSLVLPRAAWFRLRLPDGTRYGELLLRNGQISRDWHGLQLIWRQRRAAFGGHSVS